jgi:hypothetical protein
VHEAELLPLPLTPVSTVKRPSGMLTSMFLRLFAVAPVTRSQPSFDFERRQGTALAA